MGTEVWNTVAAFVSAGATVGIMIAAFKGVTAWRIQLRGTTEYDLARRVLRAVYRLRNELEYFRRPIMTSLEWQDCPDRDKRDQDDWRNVGFAYEKRWARVIKAGTALDGELVEAEVVWGNALKDATREIRECSWDLQVNIEQYIEMRKPGPQSSEYTPEEIRKIRDVVFRHGSEQAPDPYVRKLRQAVEKFEAVLKPHFAR